MCTLAVAVRPSSDVALLVAANRDEALARPSSGPRLWEGPPAFLVPRDEQAGGTWLGLNAHGVFVGVTNRFQAPRDTGRSSRGHLVLEALRQPSARVLHAALAGLSPRTYNAFHLFYADRTSAHVTWTDGEQLHQLDVAPGLHVITERSFQHGALAREATVRALWAAAGEPPSDEGLMQLLGTHAPDGALPLDAPCVHAPAIGYGTRSGLVLRLGESWSTTRLWWAEGPPCTTAFEDLTALAQALAPGGA
ncbi:MAG: NRDE family protein [Myxococcaceae bacterium]|nr:NRDE family protein [Myxococcaceae bacterium]MCI0669122.1 NRDE family protein [Myxococcaceae bacterium]